MANKRLGRGLEALIPQMAENEASERRESLSDIKLTKIRANPLQPRMEFNRERLDELKSSISENGVIQPITVRKTAAGFELVAGERRFRAVTELGFDRIPAYVMEVKSDEHLLELALIENIQREDLNPVEVALAYQQLQKEYSLTQEDVARKVGKDRATVANFIRLLKLPDTIQNSVRIGEIGMGHAKAIMGLSSRGDQIQIWKRCIKDSFSVRKLEQEVRKQLDRSDDDNGSATKQKKSAFIVELEGRLRDKLKTQIKITTSKKGGRIEVAFYSNDDLERLMEMLDSIEG
ncbi:ParB/RepB/Spo0J family partition protein [bacterium]|nr:ParB/RepB/Spo0J family partition protein [bacterium]